MPFPRPARLLPLACSTALILLTAACSGDEIQAPTEPIEGTAVVDAADGWAYFSLADEQVVSVADPSASSSWDIAFNATNVMLNGGAAGPGGVSGYCICQNAGATPEQVLAMTATSELPDFEAVAAGDVPAAGFTSEALAPAISGWYTGSGENVSLVDRAYLLRLRNGTSFAKIRVTGVTGSVAGAFDEVTVEYAVQPTSTDPFGAVQTAILEGDGSTLDLVNGTADGAEWDLALDGTDLRTNAGVSGTGSAGAAETEEAFGDIVTASVDSRAYRTDGFAGEFRDHPWYLYNVLGNHQVHPNYEVYLVKRGGTVYKVQLTGYYGAGGEPRQIAVRYAELVD